nr:hypothetical protein [Tanacetum cinerariifolium]
LGCLGYAERVMEVMGSSGSGGEGRKRGRNGCGEMAGNQKVQEQTGPLSCSLGLGCLGYAERVMEVMGSSGSGGEGRKRGRNGCGEMAGNQKVQEQ